MEELDQGALLSSEKRPDDKLPRGYRTRAPDETESSLQADALIKNKIKFSSYIRKFRGIGCKVIYD